MHKEQGIRQAERKPVKSIVISHFYCCLMLFCIHQRQTLCENSVLTCGLHNHLQQETASSGRALPPATQLLLHNMLFACTLLSLLHTRAPADTAHQQRPHAHSQRTSHYHHQTLQQNNKKSSCWSSTRTPPPQSLLQ